MIFKTAALSFALVLAAGSAMAAETVKSFNDAPKAASQSTAPQSLAIGDPVSSAYSRLSALITHNPSTGSLMVVRSRGMSRVSSPAVGVYCITPSTISSTSTPLTIPVVTPNYSYSSGNQLFAYVRSNAPQCSSGQIGVVTFRVVNGSLLQSDYVGFNIVVP
jgi:hypothetical protein